MKRELLALSLSALALTACPPAEAPPKSVNIAPPPPPTPAEQPGAALVSLLPMDAPKAVTIDGDLAEWGAFPPAPPSEPRAYTYDEYMNEMDNVPQEVNTEPPGNPDPKKVGSRVAFAFTSDAAYLAADLGEAAKEGVWIALGARPAELPLVGQYFGRMGFQPLNCEQKPMVEGEDGDQGYWMEKRTPEEAAACTAIKTRIREAAHKHEARFEKLYRIDPTGVRVAGPNGALTAVEGAKSAWKAGPHGATVEVSLPLLALPRMAESPLETIRILARTDVAPPLLTPQAWLWLKLPAPVGFEPFAALRKHAFARANDIGEGNSPGTTVYKESRALSFQPGDPMHMEIVDSQGCEAMEIREIPLYERLASFGDVEIVRAAAPRGISCRTEMEPWIATLKKGEVKDILKLNGGFEGKMLRGDEIHILAYDTHVWEPTPGVWSVLGFGPSGEKRDVPVSPVPGYDPFDGKPNDGPAVYWEENLNFVSPDLESFGWKGVRANKGFEAVWKWDAASKSYKGEQHKADIKKAPKKPAPKKAAPKKAAPVKKK
ncbi:MAG: hypothetical protein U0441_19875 [Polyangiaceae bacterium]